VKKVERIAEWEPRTLKEYRNFVSLLLSFVIMFNTKRGGEAARMTLANYNAHVKTNERDDFDLSPLEKKLRER
jgi:hypothetical protein